MTLMYQTMITSQNAFCIVAEKNEEVIGFVSGATSVGGFYKEFLKNNFLRASIILLPKVFNPLTIKKIIETLFYPAKKERGLPNAELLSIIVERNYQGKGISRKLFDSLIKEFKNRGIDQFKVVVGLNLKQACRFYEKMGGFLHSEIEVHKGEKSRIYVWNI